MCDRKIINICYTGLSLADELSGEEQSDVMPTGRVVGVLQRNWRDYVACFAENEVHLDYYLDIIISVYYSSAQLNSSGRSSFMKS